ncbi:hypothetical protein HYT32_00640 [Candidatus Roizmanbacteria bacterium]|nr:hypothetical protein [Candidatus Roizmanbacteria bacterium]
MNKTNQKVQPIPNQPPIKNSSNLNFAKSLAYGFVAVSVGISIAVGGYLLLSNGTTTKPTSSDESIFTSTDRNQRKSNLMNLPDAMRLKGSTGEVKTIIKSSSATKKPNSKSFLPIAFAQEVNSTRYLFYLEYAGKGNNPENPYSYNLSSYNFASGEKLQLTDTPIDAPIDFSASQLGYIIYSSVNVLYRLNIETGETMEITSTYQGPFPPSISPDGEKIALIKSNNTQIAIIDLENLAEEKSHVLPVDTLGSNSILWSPTGESIYITVHPSEASFAVTHIAEINLGSGEAKTVLATDTLKDQLLFVPDKVNKKLLFVESPTKENASLVEHNFSTGESKTITAESQLSFTGYVMNPTSSTIYYTRSDKGLIAMGLGGKQATLITQIQSTPYLKLIGFGANEDELILSGLATGRDGVQRDFYDIYTISTNSLKNIAESSALPQKGM